MLGKLKKVDIRKEWKNEPRDFTNWLSQDENLSELSDEIGIDIKFLQTEANVGRFNVDLLAEEENTGRKIIVENQLEPTNHDHLGKLLTYASGIDAEIAIWIVKDVRDEHKQAIDWLNEHTDEGINFFAIRMELWQIDDSNLAPKFQIIAKPNEWAKAVKKSTTQANLTETKVMQLDFWNKFKEYVEDISSPLKLRKPRPQHWYDISIGNSKARISVTINTKDNSLGCELYIPDSMEIFNGLHQIKEQVEDEIGEELEWMKLPSKKASRIKISRDADIEDSEKWEEYFEWIKTEAEKFHSIFPKYMDPIKAGQ